MIFNEAKKNGVWYLTKEVAELFSVCPRTVRRWVKKGLLEPRLQLLGGTHLRFVFLCSEVIRFMDKFPTPRTVDDPKMLKLLDLRRGYVKKAAAARTAKESGLEGSESETREEEPVILDHPPRRRPNQAEMARGDERSLGGDRDNEEEEED